MSYRCILRDPRPNRALNTAAGPIKRVRNRVLRQRLKITLSNPPL